MEGNRLVTKLSSATCSTVDSSSVVTTESSNPPFDDIITEDGIVSTILSSLPLREAVRTSILSPRWRHLWNHRPILYFGAKNMLDAHTLGLIFGGPVPITNEELVRLVRGRRDHFIESVNSVLRQLQGRPKLDEFQVRYFLQRKHSHHLDAWLRYAVESKPRVLAFHLHKPLCKEFVKYPYHFPCDLIGTSSVEELTLECCSLKPPCHFGLSHLRKLTLYSTDVTDDDVSRLLSSSYALEHLKLVGCQQLVTISVPHPLNRLESLVVRDCDQVREININAKNLTSLFYCGYPVNFICGQYYSQLKDTNILFKTVAGEASLDLYLNKLSIIAHLQSLSFRIAGMSKVPDLTRGVNNFLQLKRLDLCWNANVKMSLLHLATLLGATPCLEELILALWVASSGEPDESLIKEPNESLRKLRKTLPISPHTRLRTIQIDNFYYEIWHIGITLYLLINATELGSMKIRPNRGGLDETQKTILTKEVPVKVKLVIC